VVDVVWLAGVTGLAALLAVVFAAVARASTASAAVQWRDVVAGLAVAAETCEGYERTKFCPATCAGAAAAA